MSLTSSDLQEIRNIIKEEIQPVQGELHALRNDIKEIYDMIAQIQSEPIITKEFDKLSIEKKILTLNSKLVSAAKQAGITLPR